MAPLRCGAGAACRRASMRVTPQPSARRRCRYAFVLALALASAPAMRGAGAAETLTVVLDQAQIMQLPDRVGTIIIGNPLIADVALQAGGNVVVTGKGYGSTNLIVLDPAGGPG